MGPLKKTPLKFDNRYSRIVMFETFTDKDLFENNNIGHRSIIKNKYYCVINQCCTCIIFNVCMKKYTHIAHYFHFHANNTQFSGVHKI